MSYVVLKTGLFKWSRFLSFSFTFKLPLMTADFCRSRKMTWRSLQHKNCVAKKGHLHHTKKEGNNHKEHRWSKTTWSQCRTIGKQQQIDHDYHCQQVMILEGQPQFLHLQDFLSRTCSTSSRCLENELTAGSRNVKTAAAWQRKKTSLQKPPQLFVQFKMLVSGCVITHSSNQQRWNWHAGWVSCWRSFIARIRPSICPKACSLTFKSSAQNSDKEENKSEDSSS